MLEDTAENAQETTEEESEKKRLYDARVIELIRLRYSPDDELAILRKKLSGNPSDFGPYNAYVNRCRRQAKQEVYGK